MILLVRWLCRMCKVSGLFVIQNQERSDYSLIIAPHALRCPRLKIRFGLLAAVPKKASSRQNLATGGVMLLTT